MDQVLALFKQLIKRHPVSIAVNRPPTLKQLICLRLKISDELLLITYHTRKINFLERFDLLKQKRIFFEQR